jgi:hypothetical protein
MGPVYFQIWVGHSGRLNGAIAPCSSVHILTRNAAWVEKDQQLLSYLLSLISREVLVHLTEHQTMHETWKAIQVMFASQSRARV